METAKPITPNQAQKQPENTKTPRKQPQTPTFRPLYVWRETPRGIFSMLENWLYNIVQREKAFWAVDSEFLMSGRIAKPEDIMTVQFSNGTDTAVLESPSELKSWLRNHYRVKTLYGFSVLCEIGSLREWLGTECVSKPHKRGQQTWATVNYDRFHAVIYDIQPLLKGFGLNTLEKAGATLGTLKLDKPTWLGVRHWCTEREHREFLAYAKQDAIVTSMLTRWLHDTFNVDPTRHASTGTLARDAFELSARLTRAKEGYIHVSWLEHCIHKSTFAGRSECFRNGYIPNAVYNDIASQYPVCCSVTRALEITGATPCPVEDLDLVPDTPLDTRRYGWVEGAFETHSDRWGLPVRVENNIYCTGIVNGLFHSFDVIAARARVLHVAHAYKPTFKPTPIHDQFVKDTIDRVEDRLKGAQKMYKKAVLNSLTGKLGQSHPIAETSNFYAYHTIVAHAHLLTSRLFDKCPTEIYGMDTDSIFSLSNMQGKWFELSDGEYTIPVKIDVKGRGDLAYFRSKQYILKPTSSEPVYARHAWCYDSSDFLKLHDGSIRELTTRKDVKHTIATRVKEAQKMAYGRWFNKPETLSLEKLKDLLKCDLKRKRVNRDSYALVMQHRSEPSSAWSYEDLLFELEAQESES